MHLGYESDDDDDDDDDDDLGLTYHFCQTFRLTVMSFRAFNALTDKFAASVWAKRSIWTLDGIGILLNIVTSKMSNAFSTINKSEAFKWIGVILFQI